MLLAAAFWLCVQVWRRLSPVVARLTAIVAVPLALVLPAQVVHRSVLDVAIDAAMDVLGDPVVYSVVGLAFLAAGVWLVVRTWSALRLLSSALVFMFPLLPVLALQTAWVQWHRPPDDVYAGPMSPTSSGAAPTRIVVMVFD